MGIQAGEPHLSASEGTISTYRRNTRFTGGSQHEFMKRKSCIFNLKPPYNKVIGLVGRGVRTLDVLYLTFNKAFDSVSHVTFTEQLQKCIW